MNGSYCQQRSCGEWSRLVVRWLGLSGWCSRKPDRKMKRQRDLRRGGFPAVKAAGRIETLRRLAPGLLPSGFPAVKAAGRIETAMKRYFVAVIVDSPP
jgi:hypothetical protein